FVDETRAPVLDPGRGRTKTGYFWSIARDDSAWRGDTGPPAVVYTYAPGRGAEHATTLLAGYRGIVQCDGYAAYKQVARRRPRRQRRDLGLLLGPLAPAVLRDRQGRVGADRRGGAAADRRALQDRSADPRQERRGASGGTPSRKQAAGCRAEGLA